MIYSSTYFSAAWPFELEKQFEMHEKHPLLKIHKGLDKYYGEILIGHSITDMKKDQTLNEFFEETFNDLKEIGFSGNIEDLKFLIDGGKI